MLSAHRTNGPGGDEMAKMVEMSNVTEQGVADVKNLACDLLLAHRVEKRRAYQGGARVRDRLNRLVVTPFDGAKQPALATAVPMTDGDDEERGASIPASLKCDEWRTDLVPEIMDGKNVLDFVDEDIVAKLALLDEDEAEAEEGLESAAREAAHAALSPAELALVTARDKKVLNRRVAQAARGRRNAPVPRQARLRSEGAAGNDEDDATVRGRAKSAP
ncbi:hypothetical protein JL720_11984 [Aureococcus anophagefferens]|nr:hypothetical protein JL720_11984 [Aureococcus anophagefferens]